MVQSWYKYRPVYTQGAHEWKYIKTHFSMKIAREVIMEDGNVNVFSKDFIKVELQKIKNPPVEAIEQAISLSENILSTVEYYLVGLRRDLENSKMGMISKMMKSTKMILKTNKTKGKFINGVFKKLSSHH